LKYQNKKTAKDHVFVARSLH